MAQLPSKVPNMVTHNWPSFPHQQMSFISNHHHLTNAQANTNATIPAANTMAINNNHNQQPSWVDDLLDFSSVQRGAHRRSISDSITFLDPASLVEDCRDNVANALNNNIPETENISLFGRLDDEQLMSMFSDDISVAELPSTVSSSNPSTPSDQNSNNDEKTTQLDQQVQQLKNEPGEVDGSSKNELSQPPSASNGGTIFDPKRVKRILANRQSAQRSRVRKQQYISELERSVTTLQTELSALSPRVAFLDHQRLILNVDNSALKQRIAALAQDKSFKDAHQEALKKEIERLRQVYHQQNLKKMNNNNNNNDNAAPTLASAAPPQQPPINTYAIVCTDKDPQLLS